MTRDDYIRELEEILGVPRTQSAIGRSLHACQFRCYGRPSLTIIGAEGTPPWLVVFFDHSSGKASMRTSKRMRHYTIDRISNLVKRFMETGGFIDALRCNNLGHAQQG